MLASPPTQYKSMTKEGTNDKNTHTTSSWPSLTCTLRIPFSSPEPPGENVTAHSDLQRPFLEQGQCSSKGAAEQVAPLWLHV